MNEKLNAIIGLLLAAVFMVCVIVSVSIYQDIRDAAPEIIEMKGGK